MTWTTEKPTTPGWYWLKQNGENKGCVEVDNYPWQKEMGLLVFTRNAAQRVAEVPGEWAGPIEPPI